MNRRYFALELGICQAIDTLNILPDSISADNAS